MTAREITFPLEWTADGSARLLTIGGQIVVTMTPRASGGWIINKHLPPMSTVLTSVGEAEAKALVEERLAEHGCITPAKQVPS